jgi:hypothetical protein
LGLNARNTGFFYIEEENDTCGFEQKQAPDERQTRKRGKKYGVPGQVRTANLPLRRVNLEAARLEETQHLQGFSSGCVRENHPV